MMIPGAAQTDDTEVATAEPRARIRRRALRDFQKPEVGHKVRKLALGVYRATAPFSRAGYCDFSRRLRRTAASVPANFAEGCASNRAAELARFLRIGMGPAGELEDHLLLARDLEGPAKADCERLDGDIIEAKRMLTSLIQKPKAGD